MKTKILHIASWYPSEISPTDGSFVHDQIRLFLDVFPADVIQVKVVCASSSRFGFKFVDLQSGGKGFFLFMPFGMREGSRFSLWLSSIWLMLVLIACRAWRYQIFHFHIAIPLLVYVGLWNKFWRKKIIITEHWSAYHFNFDLPYGSRAHRRLSSPFKQGYPVFSVSNSLARDLLKFSNLSAGNYFVIPNYVPLHGASERHSRNAIVLFTVNRWVGIKNPLPMIRSVVNLIDSGVNIELVVGGDGPLLAEMKSLCRSSRTQSAVVFRGWMTKGQISKQLAKSDAYIFNSIYETFSIACAEALGAGLPWIGPEISSILEYSSVGDFQIVENGESTLSWNSALHSFLYRFYSGQFKRHEIASRAFSRLGSSRIKSLYASSMSNLLKSPKPGAVG